MWRVKSACCSGRFEYSWTQVKIQITKALQEQTLADSSWKYLTVLHKLCRKLFSFTTLSLLGSIPLLYPFHMFCKFSDWVRGKAMPPLSQPSLKKVGFLPEVMFHQAPISTFSGEIIFAPWSPAQFTTQSQAKILNKYFVHGIQFLF